eukprot:GHVS01041952.1.p1 GENE.GHVS01041952.1~~GHVS01041952.1.p1  ORF type:complete len:561 (-),score=196.06 GHVS01041952.1:242-1924(-)
MRISLQHLVVGCWFVVCSILPFIVADVVVNEDNKQHTTGASADPPPARPTTPPTTTTSTSTVVEQQQKSIYVKSISLSLLQHPQQQQQPVATNSSHKSLISFTSTSPHSPLPDLMVIGTTATDKQQLQLSVTIGTNDLSSVENSDANKLSQLSVLVSLISSSTSPTSNNTTPPTPANIPSTKLLFFPQPSPVSSSSLISSTIALDLSNSKQFLPVDGLYLFELLAAAADTTQSHHSTTIRLSLAKIQLTFSSRLRLVQVPIPSTQQQQQIPPTNRDKQQQHTTSTTTSNSTQQPPTTTTAYRYVVPGDVPFLPQPLIFHTFDVPPAAGRTSVGAFLFVCFCLPLVALLYFWIRADANISLVAKLFVTKTNRQIVNPQQTTDEEKTNENKKNLKRIENSSSSSLCCGDKSTIDISCDDNNNNNNAGLVVGLFHLSFICLLFLVFGFILLYFVCLDLFTVARYLCYTSLPLFYIGHGALSSLRQYKQQHNLYVNWANNNAQHNGDQQQHGGGGGLSYARGAAGTGSRQLIETSMATGRVSSVDNGDGGKRNGGGDGGGRKRS